MKLINEAVDEVRKKGGEKERVKADDETLNLRLTVKEKRKTNYKPSENHPWKKGFVKRNVTFSSSN